MKILVKIMQVNPANGLQRSMLNELKVEGVWSGDIIEGEFCSANKAVDFKSPKTGIDCCAFVDYTCKKLSDLTFEELCTETQDIVLSVENTYQLRDKVSNLIKSLIKKSKKQEISLQKLIESSVIENLCRQGVKECRDRGNEDITTIHRKEFKHYYSQHILNEVESGILNQ